MEYIMERMKYRCFCIVFLLAAVILLNGCFTCSESEETKSLDTISYNKISIAVFDSLMNQYASDHEWESYTKGFFDQHGGWGNEDEDNLENKFMIEAKWVGSHSYESNYVDGIVFSMILYACSPDGDGDAKFGKCNTLSTLYLDLYGCNEFSCRNTARVVVRDKDYQYVRSYDKSQFKISSAGDFSYDEFGHDCSAKNKLNFNLFVDDDDFKIDWRIKYGEVTCYNTHCHEVSDFSIWG